jgi:hypothetical protein
MLHTSKLRGPGRNGFMRRRKPLWAAFLLLLLLPAAASAYTVVLRNGRTVDIPATFSVSRAGITYEHAPGLYVTIQMTSIDVAATERANNEAEGSLLKRAGNRVDVAAVSVAPGARGGSSAPRRTLTDKELEAVRARREASEAVYERRRVELGLPSIEATRLKREEEARRLSEMAAQSSAGEAELETQWRARATELRTALAVNEAEINYVSSKLRQMTGTNLPFSYPLLTTFPIVLTVPGRFPAPGFPPAFPRGPRPPRVPSPRAPFSGRVGFGGGGTRGRIGFNPRGVDRGYPGRRPFGAPGVNILPVPVYAPFAYGYNSYDQSVLSARLHELEEERAGLRARWRLLEEEARLAGVPPGWLRP